MRDDLFVVSSFSKYFNMTGWRLGWVVAPERHVRDLEKLAQNLYISPPTVSQRAALACFLPETLAILEERRRAFRDAPRLPRACAARAGLRHSGHAERRIFRLRRQLALFAATARPSAATCSQGAGVAITPGIDFGTHRASDHVRFAYTIDMAKLEDGVARLARFLGRAALRIAAAQRATNRASDARVRRFQFPRSRC